MATEYLDECPCKLQASLTKGGEPFSLQVRPCVEELAEGGWRVCCYGCRVLTFTWKTKEEAIAQWEAHRAWMAKKEPSDE